MDKNLIEMANTTRFISLWFQWHELYQSELSNRNHIGFGYQGGAFFPEGANNGRYHMNWLEFHESLAMNGTPYISIHALFGYSQYDSCKLYIDSEGRNFTIP